MDPRGLKASLMTWSLDWRSPREHPWSTNSTRRIVGRLVVQISHGGWHLQSMKPKVLSKELSIYDSIWLSMHHLSIYIYINIYIYIYIYTYLYNYIIIYSCICDSPKYSPKDFSLISLCRTPGSEATAHLPGRGALEVRSIPGRCRASAFLNCDELSYIMCIIYIYLYVNMDVCVFG